MTVIIRSFCIVWLVRAGARLCFVNGKNMSKKIIVADDEKYVLELILEILSEEGFVVKGVSSGEEALELSMHEKFNLMIADASLPGMDGLDAFSAIKEKQPHIVGIVITGGNVIKLAAAAIKRGFGGIVLKPFNPSDLLEAVTNALQNALILEENTRLNALIPLYRLGEKFMSAMSPEKVAEVLVDAVFKQTHAQKISVMLYDRDRRSLRIAAALGFDKDMLNDVLVEPGDRIAGWVFKHKNPLILNGGAESNPEFASFMKSKDIVAAVSLPIKTKDVVFGVVNVSRLKDGPFFKQSSIEMLNIISNQAAMALESIRAAEEKMEKLRIQTLLERYVAPEVANTLMLHYSDLLCLGEIRYLTVLFADIRESTSLVRHLSLETAKSFLNDFYGMVTDLILQARGTLDKFMGDAVLAIFGGPVYIDRSNEVAVSVAMNILARFRDLKKKWRPVNRYFDSVGIGIGISSGKIFLGNVGSEQRLDYTVIGSDVNIAQRLASEAKSGQILVSADVVRHLPDDFAVVTKSSCQPKGVEEPFDVFSVMPNT